MGFLEPSSPMAASQVGNLVKKLIWVKRRVFLKVIYNISLSLSLFFVWFCFVFLLELSRGSLCGQAPDAESEGR